MRFIGPREGVRSATSWTGFEHRQAPCRRRQIDAETDYAKVRIRLFFRELFRGRRRAVPGGWGSTFFSPGTAAGSTAMDYLRPRR